MLKMKSIASIAPDISEAIFNPYILVLSREDIPVISDNDTYQISNKNGYSCII